MQVLKKEAKITEAVLRVRIYFRSCDSHLLLQKPEFQESKAGLAVGKLRSHAAKDVSELAKEIVRMWKTAVDKEKHATGTGSKSGAKTAGAPVVACGFLVCSLGYIDPTSFFFY